MEKLRRVKIRGFRSIRDLDLELTDLTVLIGANGSGKSNLVAFFDMLSFITSENLQLYVARKGGGSSILRYGPKCTPVMTAELRFEHDEGWSGYTFSLGFAAPDRLVFTHEDVAYQGEGAAKDFSRLLDTGHVEPNLSTWATDQGDATLAKAAMHILLRLTSLKAYHFHDTSESADIRTAQDLDRNRTLLSSGSNLAAFLYMLQVSFRAHYERIVATVRLAVPFLKTFELAPDRLNAGRIQLRWHDRNPDYEFGPHHLSDGSLRAVALITALLQPEELMPSVIVIDEPELGLHPSAVGLIGQLIKAVSTKRQVVVATQSPRLLAECAPEDVVVVEREEAPAGYGWSTFRRLAKNDLGEWLGQYNLGSLYEMNVTGGGPQ